MVVWLVGQSGAGKSTIGREVYRRWKAREANTVLVDGDEIRAIFKHEAREKDYSVKGRRVNAERIVEICRWLDGQGINVVCCILCIFPEVLAANRERFSDYREVYVSTSTEVLRQRDTKGLYAAAERGEQRDVVGVDIPFPEPVAPDLVVDTSGASGDRVLLAEQVMGMIEGERR
jgi:adenylylsulfate kinase